MKNLTIAQSRNNIIKYISDNKNMNVPLNYLLLEKDIAEKYVNHKHIKKVDYQKSLDVYGNEFNWYEIEKEVIEYFNTLDLNVKTN